MIVRQLRILLVEDSDDDAELVGRLLARMEGARVQLDWVRDYDEALREVRRLRHDIYLVDYRLGTADGLELLREAVRMGCQSPLILLTGMSSRDVDLEAMQVGAADYLEKSDMTSDLLERSIRYAMARKEAEMELARQSKEAKLLQQTTAIAAEPGPLELKLAEILHHVCTAFGWPAGHCYVPDNDGDGDLKPSGIWYFSDPRRYTVFRTATESTRFASGQGLPGRIFASRKAAWIRDVRHDDGFHRAIACQQCGILGALGCPVIINGNVIAVLEFFSSEEFDADPQQLRLIEYVGDQTGRIFERQAAEEVLKEKEEQLRQSQKMEAIGALAGGVAHEFNNLLQAIQGYARFATLNLETDHAARHDLEQVVKASDRASKLIRQLLGFARRQAMQANDVQLQEVVDDVRRLLKPLIGAHISQDIQCSHGVGAVRGDTAMLEQVLVNLCLNARDAMPDGGTLTLRLREVQFSEEVCLTRLGLLPGCYAHLQVRDTGRGMDENTMQRIFEPFFTTKEPGKGTGLGLAMVYGAVQQHSGKILVNSKPGEGTTFDIYLPVTAAAQPSRPNPVPAESVGGNETILVAEDESLVRDIAVRILASAGYHVLVASDGHDALRVFDEHRADVALVLLDIVMPNMGGREAFQRMQKVRPDLRAIFATAYSPEEYALHLGDEQLPVIDKPFDPDELLTRVRTALDGQAPRRHSDTAAAL
jgi:two-component system, cell cycle sensor histidine kinase and response regulator CckA